jgi:hypothetical protein
LTGEKNRYTTHEKFWKLDDEQLSTPKHDEMVLQLLNPVNALKFLKFIGYKEESWEYHVTTKFIRDENSDDVNIRLDYFKYGDQLEKIYTKMWDLLDQITPIEFSKNLHNNILKNCPFIDSEVPIKSGYNNFIIGYVDVQLSISNSLEYGIVTDGHEINGINCHGEPYTIYRYVGNIIRMQNESLGITLDPIKVNIEVKPSIDSFGKTLRQINTYRVSDPSAIYCIFSPDTRFREAFKTQNVKFVTPEDIGIK